MVVYGEGAYRCGEHGPVRPGPRPASRLAAGRFEPPCPHCGADLVPVAVTEDAPPDPRSVYAATKLHQEHLTTTCALAGGPPVTALRYHNVYGPRMPRDQPHTVGELAAALAAATSGPAPEIVGGWRAGDVRHVFASPALAAARLGFRARVGFAEGVAEFADAELREPVPAGP
jgi:dTDP-L-rhamnose 4-epimerase